MTARENINQRLVIELRQATNDDSEFAYETKKLALGEYVRKTWGWDETFQQKFHQELWNPQNEKVITLDGCDVGKIVVLKRSEHLLLESIYILPEYQNRGIGTHLIRQVIDNARREKKPVRLQVLKINPAVNLYKRLRFQTTSKTETHFVMERQI